MIEVSAFDAKTHLSDLLSKVQKGEHIRITKHKTPVAYLIPVEGQLSNAKNIFDAFKQFSLGKSSEGLTDIASKED